MSEAQLGILLGHQLNADSALYNAGEYIALSGKLDLQALKHAITVAWHEAPALQMSYQENQGKLCQRLAHTAPLIEEHSVAHHADPMAAALAIMQASLQQRLNIAEQPVAKNAIITLGKNQALWYLQIHHIACDGYGFALFGQRVASLYNAKTCHQEDHGVSFGDYQKVLAEDQRYQQSPAREKDQQFWLDYLAHQQTPVSLSRSTQPAKQLAHKHSANLGQTISAKLKQVPNGQWPEFLMAVVADYLHHQTGASQVTLGMPFMGRMGSASIKVPAMVMNILPLLTHPGEHQRFDQLLNEIISGVSRMRRHGRYRYEHLKRDLNLIGGSKKLFGPIVNVMPFDRSLPFNGLSASAHTLSAGPVEDLAFNFIVQPDDSIKFELEANPSRYQLAQVATIHQQIVEILDTTLTHQDRDLIEISPQLSLLHGQPITQAITPVYQAFLQTANTQAGHIAIEHQGRQVSYGELLAKVKTYAQQLEGMGLKPGHLIALALTRGVDAIALSLAALQLEAGYLFIDPHGPADRNTTVLKDASPDLIIGETTKPLYGFQGVYCSVETLGQTRLAIASSPREALTGLAYLIYTSGSTGKPKGVMIGQQAMAAFVAQSRQSYSISNQDRVLQFAPLIFDTSIEEIFVSLCAGATLVLRNDEMLASCEAFLATCQQWQISVLDLPTAYWHELAYCLSPGQLPDCLKTVIIGGEAAQTERVNQWHQASQGKVALLNTYGPSEATVVATFSKPQAGKPLTIGQPLPGRSVMVVDENGHLQPKGESGELVILGPGVGLGYLNLPEKTREAFVRHGQHTGYRSGDRVCINEDNELVYLGRLDNETKISGYRINPEEIESALVKLQGVEDATVLVTSGSGIKRLNAFLATNQGWNTASVRAALVGALPDPMLPNHVVCMPALPKNSAGKTDRKLLESHLQAQDTGNNHSNPIAQAVISVWQDILGTPEIQLNDDFFLLGGQSLQTIQVANRLSQWLKREIQVPLLFDNPVASDLVEALQNETSTKDAGSTKQQVLAVTQQGINEINALPPNLNRPGSTMLFTGASGFVGRHLLAELLAQTQQKIVCLMRAKNLQHGAEKLYSALAPLGIKKLQIEQRVEIVLADFEQPNMGLTDQQLAALTRQIGTIWHCAANTSVMRDVTSLLLANTETTKHLAMLAKRSGATFHHISTIAVAPTENGKLPEDFIDWHDGLGDGYQQSKWASEQLLRGVTDGSFPIYVYRLPRVSGHSETGASNEKDLAWNLVRSSIRLEAYPQLKVNEWWTPVDQTASALLTLATHGKPGVYNMVADQCFNLGDVFNYLKHYAMRALPMPEWLQALGQSDHPEDQTLAGFFSKQAPAPLGKVINQSTQAILTGRSATMPQALPEHLRRYVAYAQQQGWLGDQPQEHQNHG